MASITFRGAAILDPLEGGVGWEFMPAAVVPDVIEIPASIGVGYWLKPANKRPANHVLRLMYRVASAEAKLAALQALPSILRGALVVPDFGAYSKCRIADVGDLRVVGSGDKFLVSGSLTIIQYP